MFPSDGGTAMTASEVCDVMKHEYT